MEYRALQDTLRLLTLWFKYGAAPAVAPDASGVTPLMYSCAHGHVGIAQLLLGGGTAVDVVASNSASVGCASEVGIGRAQALLPAIAASSSAAGCLLRAIWLYGTHTQ